MIEHPIMFQNIGISIIVVPWNSNMMAATSRKPDKAPQTHLLAVQTTAYNKSKANECAPVIHATGAATTTPTIMHSKFNPRIRKQYFSSAA
jgi:hypothetical protein